MTGETYDVFVSYRQRGEDEQWVRNRLVPACQAAGRSVCVDYLSFRLGAAVIREMERAVVASRYVVVVMSNDYFASAFTDLEAVLARHKSLESRESTVLAVLREPGLIPPLEFRAFLWLDMYDDVEFEPAVARLVAAIGTSGTT